MIDLTITIDSREQRPWLFLEEEKKSGYKTRIVGSELGTIEAADYTIKGYEDLVRIERKNSFQEIIGNLSNKDNKDRFLRELEKLIPIKHKYLLIEANLSKDILGMSVQQSKWGFPVSRVIKDLLEIEIEYGIKPIFVGDAGQKMARYIFEMVMKNVR